MKTYIRSFILLLFLATPLAFAADPILPDPVLTPGCGSTLPTKCAIPAPQIPLSTLCTPGYTHSIDPVTKLPVRNVSSATKKAVYKEYGITPRPHAYEIDHLVSLELGGSNDIKNLWPQSYTGVNNAHIKDALEDHLHMLVCTGKVPLAEAQQAISTNWIVAYQKYIPMK